MVLLAWISAVLVIAFFLVLAVGLIRISAVLRAIGGAPTSFLARLRLGLRAIERETGHLEPQVTGLNQGLGQVADGLGEIDARLAGALDAVKRQEG